MSKNNEASDLIVIFDKLLDKFQDILNRLTVVECGQVQYSESVDSLKQDLKTLRSTIYNLQEWINLQKNKNTQAEKNNAWLISIITALFLSFVAVLIDRFLK